jgi:acyl-CoA thioester hydrolase
MNKPTPFHEFAVRVYYEDTDFSGRVYHASYIRFLERGRTEWLRALGYEHGVLAGEQGVVFAVRRLEIDYLAPAIIDDLLRVETRVSAVPGAAIDFAQTGLRADQTLATAKVLVAALRGGRPMRIPPELRARLEARS